MRNVSVSFYCESCRRIVLKYEKKGIEQYNRSLTLRYENLIGVSVDVKSSIPLGMCRDCRVMVCGHNVERMDLEWKFTAVNTQRSF